MENAEATGKVLRSLAQLEAVVFGPIGHQPCSEHTVLAPSIRNLARVPAGGWQGHRWADRLQVAWAAGAAYDGPANSAAQQCFGTGTAYPAAHATELGTTPPAADPRPRGWGGSSRAQRRAPGRTGRARLPGLRASPPSPAALSPPGAARGLPARPLVLQLGTAHHGDEPALSCPGSAAACGRGESPGCVGRGTVPGARTSHFGVGRVLGLL